jgi:hypothetical protein
MSGKAIWKKFGKKVSQEGDSDIVVVDYERFRRQG